MLESHWLLPKAAAELGKGYESPLSSQLHPTRSASG
jgi:hypothetical protein